MKKLLLFAAVAGLGLVSASPPNKGPDDGERHARHARHYPPCSRTVTDRCTQLYERGAHAAHRGEHHARGEHRGHREHHAYGGHRGHHDHGAAAHRAARPMARAARATRHVGHRVRRAGERG